MPGHSGGEVDNGEQSFEDLHYQTTESAGPIQDVRPYTPYDVHSERHTYDENGTGYVADTSSPEVSHYEHNNVQYEKSSELYSCSTYGVACQPQSLDRNEGTGSERCCAVPGTFRSTMERPKTAKRKRIITFDQRKAANIRERRRMMSLNDAFDILRRSLPTFSYEKKLSRIETLRLALTYIAFMTDVLSGVKPKDVKLLPLKSPALSRREEQEGPAYAYYM